MNLITDYPVHYSHDEYRRLKARNRNFALRSDTQLTTVGPHESFAETAQPKTPYPFCQNVDRCAGLSYCPLDPTCAD